MDTALKARGGRCQRADGSRDSGPDCGTESLGPSSENDLRKQHAGWGTVWRNCYRTTGCEMVVGETIRG